MPYRKEGFNPDEFYHIFNRGNNKEEIFFECENYYFFLRMFVKRFPQDLVEIHAFCLMPNHYHFLIRYTGKNEISRRMKSFGISYAKSINKWYKRTGHLFEGRFKVKHVDSNEYLLHLSRYIHLNPVFAKLVSKGEDWEFSSYRKYIGMEYSQGNKITGITGISEIYKSVRPQRLPLLEDYESLIKTDIILSQFSSSLEYKKFVESFSEAKMKELEESLFS